MKKWTHWETEDQLSYKTCKKKIFFMARYGSLSKYNVCLIKTNRKQIYISDIGIASTPAKDIASMKL